MGDWNLPNWSLALFGAAGGWVGAYVALRVSIAEMRVRVDILERLVLDLSKRVDSMMRRSRSTTL